ncbi:MAG: radical SAM protein, partial [Mesorhizobium sp.]
MILPELRSANTAGRVLEITTTTGCVVGCSY